MANVKAAMEYAQTFEREAMKKRLSESDLEAPTLIDVVARHEKEIQELKRLVTPMMEFNQKMPTKIVGPNLVGILNAAGFYQKKEWVGLTDDEVWKILWETQSAELDAHGDQGSRKQSLCTLAIQAKLKEKNCG